ncbi:MAG: hypothetical protein ACYS8W_05540, partial [Planctomycetota bacterium]
ALAWSFILFCLHTIPTPDVALWILLAAYSLLLNPRKAILEGEWLHVHWLAWRKSYHLASLEGVYLEENFDINRAVICLRDAQPVKLPLWRNFPGSSQDDRFRVAAHLSRIASKNTHSEAGGYERGGVRLNMHHNRLVRALGFMALGVVFTAGTLACFLYRNEWKATGDLFYAAPAVVFAMAYGVWFVFLFFRPGAQITADGARITTRFGPEEGEIEPADAELSGGNFNGLAVSPRLVVAAKGDKSGKVALAADYSSVFLALRLMQKWPPGSFTSHIAPFQSKHAEDANDQLTREFRKKMDKLIFERKREGLAATGKKSRRRMTRVEPFHPLADPGDFFDSVEEMLGLV